MSALPAIHDGPAPRHSPRERVAGWLRCHGGGGGSSTTQSQSSDTADSRVGVEGDGATVVKDTAGNVTINDLGGEVATVAIDAAVDLGSESQRTARAFAEQAVSALESYLDGQAGFVNKALDVSRDVNENTLAAAARLADGSNKIAASVADSQRAFVETASGQRSAQITIGLAVAGAVALGLILRPSK